MENTPISSVQAEQSHKRREVEISGFINVELVRNTINSLRSLDENDSKKPIRILINSSGGEYEAEKMLVEFLLKNMKSPIITIGMGEITSTAGCIFQCGDLRLMFSTAKILIHQTYDEIRPEDVGETWTAREHREAADDLEKFNEETAEYYTMNKPSWLRKCKMTKSQFVNFLKKLDDKDYTILANTARNKGFADGVIKNSKSISRFEKKLLEKLGL